MKLNIEKSRKPKTRGFSLLKSTTFSSILTYSFIMNNKAVGIGLFVIGLGVTVVFSGRLAGSIPGIVFMIIGIVFLVKPTKTNKD